MCQTSLRSINTRLICTASPYQYPSARTKGFGHHPAVFLVARSSEIYLLQDHVPAVAHKYEVHTFATVFIHILLPLSSKYFAVDACLSADSSTGLKRKSKGLLQMHMAVC